MFLFPKGGFDGDENINTLPIMPPTVDIDADASGLRKPSPQLLSTSDPSDLVLLRDENSQTIVAIACVGSDGKPSAWARIAAPKGESPLRIDYYRCKATESGDGKMGSTLSGQQGQQSKYACYGKDPLTVPTTKRELDDRRDDTRNITRRPIVRIPCPCRMWGGMHVVEGNYGHIDELLVDELQKIDNSYGKLHAEAQAQVELFAIDELNKYLTGERKKTFLVSLLDEAYKEVCGISLGNFMGGRKLTHKKVLVVLVHWEKIFGLRL